ncbi:MAG TPA: universal stress protein [Phycisphaerae bacterium]|nr:universal stress protein [Phycisphaerae bacterium]
MLKTILVAYDGSDSAERAFQFALDLAKLSQAAVSVLAVADSSIPPTAVQMAGLLESATEHFEQAFVRLREAASIDGVPMSAKTLVGQPARQIIQEATDQRVDLIAMGHGRGNWVERWLSRSVSKGVLSDAPCAVAIVR